MAKKFYITTTLPYVNADPHIGFALEIIQADVIARHQRQLGDEVVFNTGTDEHGVKIYRKALEAKQDPQVYADIYAAKFDHLKQALNLSYTNFIRTTDDNHKKAAAEFWQLCVKNGDIEKKISKINYCSGCELEKTASELVDGCCPNHPNLKLEIIEEENYFFKFSRYAKPLLEFYEKNPDFVVPDFRFNEIKKFVQSGLNDFSISRLKQKMPWGIPVPNDSDHVMYVWFDALINYISTLGWPKAKANFKKFWPGVQVAGKDNLRQQSAMWQAMLMSAGLPNSKKIFIHGFIVSGNQKMSKSLGNVVNPFELVEKYGTDALRYYLLRHINPFEDSDFTIDKFEQAYTADLSNGLGNLVSRVAGLIEQSGISIKQDKQDKQDKQCDKLIQGFLFDQALKYIWEKISKIDGLIAQTKPWVLAKEGKTKELEKVLLQALDGILEISHLLVPFLPQTAEKIEKIFTAEVIKKGEPLFPRLS
ncbi:MAG: methionine--tRNA ligase [Patescibacteria group bacterium]